MVRSVKKHDIISDGSSELELSMCSDKQASRPILVRGLRLQLKIFYADNNLASTSRVGRVMVSGAEGQRFNTQGNQNFFVSFNKELTKR